MDFWGKLHMHSVSRRLHDDRGATAVLVAASLVLLMGFAALVVDIGAGFNERRLDQTAADASVMGAAVHAVIVSSALDGALEAQRLVDQNLDRTVTDWEGCVDPDAYAIQPIPDVECISFNETGTRIRVTVPEQSIDTTFGRLFGVNTLTLDAFAEAAIEVDGGGGSLPFGLFSGVSAGTEACLKDTAGPALPPPCDGPTLGQFGPFNPYKHEPGAGFCSATNNVFVYSAALGVDHTMTSFDPDYAGGAGVSATNNVVIEGCTAGEPDLFPNSVDQDPGNKIPLLETAFLTGDTLFGVSFPGRLEDGSSPKILDALGPGTVNVNNTPLWDYLLPGACTIPGGPDIAAKKAALLACLQDWADPANPKTPIFQLGLINAQRLAFVPKYDEASELPGGTYHINSFIPVYLQGLYFTQPAGPYVVFDPTGENSAEVFDVQNLTALTSIVLDCRMLTDSPCDPEAVTTPPGADDLVTLRLAK